jgi:TonB family protein
LALPLHFLYPVSSLWGGWAVKERLGKAHWALALVLLFGCSGAIAPNVFGQDSAGVAAKRKVKVKLVPEYPEIARQLHLQGKVKIEASIAPDGHVTSAKVVGGHPILAQSAMDAVKKWRFEAGPKETTEIIEINFDQN